jgi:hypothetical protein
MDSTSEHLAQKAARIAYTKAVEGGARPHVAFDVACAAYRVYMPATGLISLRAIVARALAGIGIADWISEPSAECPSRRHELAAAEGTNDN